MSAELKTKVANPGPLGLPGFIMATVLLNLHNAALLPLGCSRHSGTSNSRYITEKPTCEMFAGRFFRYYNPISTYKTGIFSLIQRSGMPTI